MSYKTIVTFLLYVILALLLVVLAFVFVSDPSAAGAVFDSPRPTHLPWATPTGVPWGFFPTPTYAGDVGDYDGEWSPLPTPSSPLATPRRSDTTGITGPTREDPPVLVLPTATPALPLVMLPATGANLP